MRPITRRQRDRRATGSARDRVERVATLNEPWCVAWLSHFLGLHAPGLRDIRAAMRAMHHVHSTPNFAVRMFFSPNATNVNTVPPRLQIRANKPRY